MKLTKGIIDALWSRKRESEKELIKKLLESNTSPNPLGDAKKKMASFDKQVAALLVESKKIRALQEAFSKKLAVMEKSIKDKVGHDFYWDLHRGLSCGAGGYDKPAYKAEQYLDSMLRDAVLDLQVRCIVLKGDGLAKEIKDFQEASFAAAAVKKALSDKTTD